MRWWCFAAKAISSGVTALRSICWVFVGLTMLGSYLEPAAYAGLYQIPQKDDFTDPLEMRSPLNSDRMLELRIVPYTEGEHLMVVRDVTQLKQLEGMRRNFFANVSHELRTPMTVLQGYLEMTEIRMCSRARCGVKPMV